MGAHRWTVASLVAVAALALSACGGGDDSSSDDESGADAVDPAVDASQDGSDVTDASSSSGGGSVVVGDPSPTTEPGTVTVDVGGERLEYAAAGSINVNCTVTDQQVVVNLQTPEGRDFLLQGSPQTGDWFLSMTFAPGGENVTYSADSMSGRGTFTIGDNAVSYVGTVDRVVDFDVTNAEAVDAEVAVNCASAGGDPTATVDGETYVFPLSGAQSVTCEVSDTSLEVRVNRLAIDGLQLEVTGSDQGGQWVGAAVVYTADGNYTSTLPDDGTGLSIDGTAVSYAGTFLSPTGAEVEGTVDVTC